MTAPTHVLDAAGAAVPETDASDPSAVQADVRPPSTWSYRFALLFLAIYFIRPQDWVPGMAGFNIIRPIMLLWGVAIVTEGLQSPLRGFLRTPHDWAMLAFYGYIVYNAPSEAGALGGMFSLVVFYYLTTQALSGWREILGYLRLWNWLLIALALTGVLQLAGLDLTHGKEVVEVFQGRLALGTWITNNPNALGHTVVVGIPLSYMMFFWKGGGFQRFVIFPAAVSLIITCAWHTQSKGAFLVGAALTVLIFVVGRPAWVQVLVLTVALTAGVGALSFMPRMETMGNLRSEEGVMGRLLAWEKARVAIEQNTTGAGWRQFMAWIEWRDGNRWLLEPKSTHSSYVQIGGDLGKPGLFLWLLILCLALRSVIFFKARNDTEERCRRAIMLTLTGYMLSGWMINREYHTEYYLLAAMAAAFHRLAVSRGPEALAEPPVDGSGTPAIRPALAGLHWAPSGSESGLWLQDGWQNSSNAQQPSAPVWNRLDWKDITVALAATWAVLQIWDYVLRSL